MSQLNDGHKRTAKNEIRKKKIQIAERLAVREIRRLLQKHRSVGEKRLRELTVLAAHTVSPQLGKAMQKALFPTTSRESRREGKGVFD